MININDIRKVIEGASPIAFYGAGWMAYSVYQILQQHNIKIDFAVVTDKTKGNNDLQSKLKIYNLDEKKRELYGTSAMIIVVVKKSDEIENILKQNHIHNYVLINDFLKKNNTIEQLKNLKKKDLYNKLKKWHTDIYGKEDNSCNLEKLINEEIQKNYCSNSVILLGSYLTPRVIKIGRSLQRKGIHVKVLLPCMIDLDKNFLSIIQKEFPYWICETVEEIIYQILISKSKIVHCFSNYDNESLGITYLLVRVKNWLPKIVFDQYDIIHGMYKSVPNQAEKLHEEQYCLENSDGICNRGYEMEYIEKQLKFNIQGRVILFFDYTNDIYINENKNTIKETTKLSICYAGGITPEWLMPQSPLACILDFAEICRQGKCHFYVYPRIWDEVFLKRYLILEQENPWFHLKKPVSYNELSSEIKKYDYMVIPARGNYRKRTSSLTTERMSEVKKLKEKGNIFQNIIYDQNKLVFAATNKFFDSMEAGLPIIASIPKKMAELFSAEGCCINWIIEEFDFEELRKKKTKYKENVYKNRYKWSTINNIYKLIDFYKKI